MCDDGNLTSKDGCSFDCLSDETCPNGYVDFSLGEQCDDGDLQSHDGCGSSCVPDFLSRPSLLSYPGGTIVSVYDVGRSRLITFAGGLVYEYDGKTWEGRDPPVPTPTAVFDHVMAYDESRSRVVLFGGYTRSGAERAETWDWDGLRWSKRDPGEAGPGLRSGGAMVYDARRRKVVLFGSATKCVDGTCACFADTWERDGSSWVQVDAGDPRYALPDFDPWAEGSLPTSPVPCRKAVMAYDPKRGVVVLFDGQGKTDDDPTTVTWEWDGMHWKMKPSGSSPTTREDAAMAYYPNTQQVVLFGGRTKLNSLADTWGWDGTKWTEQPVSNPGPAGRSLQV